MNSFNTIFWKFISLWNTIWSWLLTSNTDPHALPSQRCLPPFKKRKKKKKNNRYCSSVQRSSSRHKKSASLLAALTDQNQSGSSDYNAIPIYPLKGSFRNFTTTNQQCLFFKQKNRNNKRQVNLLLVCQNQLRNQLPLRQRWKHHFSFVQMLVLLQWGEKKKSLNRISLLLL